MAFTFYWHDYETFGTSPAQDRPAQFAGVRTDAELREQGEPLTLYCRLPPDYLPQPDACLVHGIAPQLVQQQGVVEREFIARIVAELGRSGTCGVGYNNIRFDDEVTRHTLYRNFHDPYQREYRDGNTRWDLLDVMRMARLLRPDGLAWPDREGRPSFKLEDLSRANGIEHAAHDALGDVRATIELARRLRRAQPKLFEYALRARDKLWVLQQLDLRANTPVLHVSARFSAEHGAAALVAPLAQHPVNRNSVIACNLALDPAPLIELDADTLRKLLYTRSDALPEGIGRIPLKEIHANKCPMVAPEAMITPAVAARMGIDRAACHANLERLRAAPGLAEKLRAVFGARAAPLAPRDPEADLYGGFASDSDRRLCQRVRASDGEALASRSWPFADPRLAELLFRYRARNFPATLDSEERLRWQEHCHQRVHGPAAEGRLDLAGFRARIAALQGERAGDARALELLDRLAEYGESLAAH